MHFIFKYLLIIQLDKEGRLLYFSNNIFVGYYKHISLIYKISSNHIPLNIEGNLIKLSILLFFLFHEITYTANVLGWSLKQPC